MAGEGYRLRIPEKIWPPEGLNHGLRRLYRVLRARYGLSVTPEQAELLFWEGFIRTRGYDWPQDFEIRLDPSAPLTEELIAKRIARVEGRPRILDVGAGPTTILGYTYDDVPLDIVAVDPLADGYAALWRHFGIEPPLPVHPGAGEDLLELFDPATFDFAFARNSLDHSLDPSRIISNMVELVRPGGWVVLRHHRNEGEEQAYEDLHRWNFDLREGDLIVWNPDSETSVTEALAGRAVIEETGYHPLQGLTCALRVT